MFSVLMRSSSRLSQEDSYYEKEAGDVIAFDIEDNAVHIRKARPVDLAFARSLESTLNEWASEADEEVYRDL